MSGVRRGCWEGWLQEVCKMIKIALTFEALTRVRSDMFCWQKVFKKKSPLKHNGDFIKTRGKMFTAVVYSDGTFHIISMGISLVTFHCVAGNASIIFTNICGCYLPAMV